MPPLSSIKTVCVKTLKCIFRSCTIKLLQCKYGIINVFYSVTGIDVPGPNKMGAHPSDICATHNAGSPRQTNGMYKSSFTSLVSFVQLLYMYLFLFCNTEMSHRPLRE